MGTAVLILLWIVVVSLVGSSLYFPFRLRRRWEKPWKNVALTPLAIPLFAAAFIAVGKMNDPNSHALFPFEIIIACLCSLIATGVVVLIRRMSL